MDVAGFLNRFCILLDSTIHVWVALATHGHIRSLIVMIFSVHVISIVFLLSIYTNSIKVSNHIALIASEVLNRNLFVNGDKTDFTHEYLA